MKIYYIEENLGDMIRVYDKCSQNWIELADEYISNFGGIMYRDGIEIRYKSDDSLAATIRDLLVI